MTSTSVSPPSWLLGTWRREWIRKGGVTKSALAVHYLQTPSAFADVRIPYDRPPIRARSFAELSTDELAALAKQRGFAGYAEVEGDVVTWHHEIDFQPPDPDADAGRVERSGSAMLEYALDGSYEELWWPLSSGDGKFLVLEARSGGRLEGLLVIAGDHFIYARSRAVDLPAAGSLSDSVLAPRATREQIRVYLDCEVSHGLLRGGTRPWEIEHSTLPWREGEPMVLPGSVHDGVLVPSAGWTIRIDTFPPADVARFDLSNGCWP